MFPIILSGYGTATVLSFHAVSSYPQEPLLALLRTGDGLYQVALLQEVPAAYDAATRPVFSHQGPLRSYHSRFDAETSYLIDLKEYAGL